MRAILSLFRLWLYGTGVFVATTVTLALALTLAIAGPPTDEEMAGVGTLVAALMRDAGAATEQAGARLCEGLPGEVCGRQEETRFAEVAPAIETPPVIDPVPSRAEPPAETAPREAQTELPLLGGRDGEARRAPAAAARASPAPRASRRPVTRRAETRRAETQRSETRARRTVRATPPAPPVESPQRVDIERLAEAARQVLAEPPPVYGAEWREPEEEANPPYEEPAEEPYADDAAYEDWEDDLDKSDVEADEEYEQYYEPPRRYWRRRY